MPILDIDDNNRVGESRPPDIPRRLYRTNEELGTSTLFSKDHSLDSIMQYISGMKWTVDYFLQLRNVNDELVGLDTALPATLQKYHRISKLIILLQSGIEQSDLDSIEGEAVINAGFLPNKYDCFLATLTGGREAIFQVTDVELRKYSLHDAYWVKFKLLTFVDSNNAKLYNNLLYKTVKEYIYDKNSILDKSAPVVLQADYNKRLRLKDRYKELVDYYFKNFINKTKRVISPPTHSSIYTDTMLTDFLFSIINQEDSDQLHKLNRLSEDNIQLANFTIWDVILNRDPDMLRRAEMHIGFKYIPYDITSIRARAFNYLGVAFVAAKLDDNESGVIPDYVDISTYYDYYPPTFINVSDDSAVPTYPNLIPFKLPNKPAKAVNGRGAVLFPKKYGVSAIGLGFDFPDNAQPLLGIGGISVEDNEVYPYWYKKELAIFPIDEYDFTYPVDPLPPVTDEPIMPTPVLNPIQLTDYADSYFKDLLDIGNYPAISTSDAIYVTDEPAVVGDYSIIADKLDNFDLMKYDLENISSSFVKTNFRDIWKKKEIPEATLNYVINKTLQLASNVKKKYKDFDISPAAINGFVFRILTNRFGELKYNPTLKEWVEYLIDSGYYDEVEEKPFEPGPHPNIIIDPSKFPQFNVDVRTEITKDQLIEKIKEAISKLSGRLPMKPEDIVDVSILANTDLEITDKHENSLIISQEALGIDLSIYKLQEEVSVGSKDENVNIDPNFVPKLNFPSKHKEKKLDFVFKKKLHKPKPSTVVPDTGPKPVEPPKVEDKPIEEEVKPVEEVGYLAPIKFPDETYVVSRYCYKQELDKCGIIEYSLIEYLNGKICNLNDLEKMLEQYHMWNTRDQFYLIPILIVLVKDYINNIFKSI